MIQVKLDELCALLYRTRAENKIKEVTLSKSFYNQALALLNNPALDLINKTIFGEPFNIDPRQRADYKVEIE